MQSSSKVLPNSLFRSLKKNIHQLQQKIVHFCQHFQNLCGENEITPNIHLHCHLLECVKNFGPIYSFWVFAFERFNGILGSYPTSNRSFEVEVMRKFSRISVACSFKYDEASFSSHIEPLKNTTKEEDSRVEETVFMKSTNLQLTSTGSEIFGKSVGKFKRQSLKEDVFSALKNHLFRVHGHANIDNFVDVYMQHQVGDELFSSCTTRAKKHSHVLVVCPILDDTCEIYPGHIQFFFCKNIAGVTHFFAVVRYFQKKTVVHQVSSMTDIKIFKNTWNIGKYNKFDDHCVIPVCRIVSKFFPSVKNDSFIACPLPRRFCV